MGELNAFGRHWPGRDDVSQSNYFEMMKVQNQNLVISLQDDLDRGEAETIALALEIQSPLVIMDEREGRRAAERLGLRCIGVIGILIQAKRQRKLSLIRPHLDALRNVAGFYIGDTLYKRILLIAGENE